MIASHRDGEITFYEELGIEPDASPEQIREAFRLSVRLLHPDQQTDPQLKELAEKQMRKLNRIYAILSDPDSRRDYNETLDEDYVRPVILSLPVPRLKRLPARLAWVAAIGVSAGLLIWLAFENTPGGQSSPALESSPPPAVAAAAPGPNRSDPAAAASAQIARLQADLRSARMERDAAVHELARLREEAPVTSAEASAPPVPSSEQPRPPVTITELPTTPQPPVSTVAASSARTERPVNRRLDGFWFYAKPPQGQINKNKALYLPDYIEATITEDGGSIHGTFRARYIIPDRAISPDVNFTFSGIRTGSQVNCPWTGAGGARGDLTLKLTSENSMRIDWNASQLGGLGLSSGTAVLTRRIE